MNKQFNLDIQLELLDQVLPIPEHIPKVYLLGDTGTGKTTLISHLLGTAAEKFPSVQARRTTVTTTEFVLSRSLDFRAALLLKSEVEIRLSVAEIIESTLLTIAIKSKKRAPKPEDFIECMGESPDQRFRLKHLLSPQEMIDDAKQLMDIIWPKLQAGLKQAMQQDEGASLLESERQVIALQDCQTLNLELADRIMAQIAANLAAQLEGAVLSAEPTVIEVQENERAAFLDRLKSILGTTRGRSLSPLISFARVQGGLLADWVPEDSALVLIDGEGIGHDTKEAATLAVRHLEFFRYANAIVLVEESKKPFVSGGTNVIGGVVNNGYFSKFNLLFSKLDEVEAEEEGETIDTEGRRRIVTRALRNASDALAEKKIEADFELQNVYYVGGLKETEVPEEFQDELLQLLDKISQEFSAEKPGFIAPILDFEMLSGHLENASLRYRNMWQTILNQNPWQTIKAFNRRMDWGWDFFRDLEPVASMQNALMHALGVLIATPEGWESVCTPELQRSSIEALRQVLSKNLLDLSRQLVLKDVHATWEEGANLWGAGSTFERKDLIGRLMDSRLPPVGSSAAITFKNAMKQLILAAIEQCKET